MRISLRDLDAKQINASSREKQAEFRESTVLGAKFEADKTKIEQRIKEIEESSLAIEDRQDMLVVLEV